MVSTIGPYTVRQVPVGVGLTLGASPSACLHTTEGSTLSGAVATISSTGFAPHFTVGDDAIVQMRDLDRQGAALRAHNDHFIQIEAVGFARSDLKLHILTPSTFAPLVALTAWMRDELGIPLHRPKGWSDRLTGTVANNNSRRQSGKALTERGWYGHVDVPDQAPTWHYDPGSFSYSTLFEQAETGDEDVNLETYQKGWDAFVVEFKTERRDKPANSDPGPPKTDKPAWFRNGWNAARFASNHPKAVAT